MYTKKLFYSCKMKCADGGSFSVNYFITEETDIISESICPYGISLEKTPCRGVCEVYSATGCFIRESNAKLLLEKLYEHSVTPVLASDSIDILMENCDFKY